MSEIGRILKESREKKNITLDQIASKLRVKREYLSEIEDKSDLPQDVFTIGYIRLYAKYLKVDIENQINAFKNGEDFEEEEEIISVDEDESDSIKNLLLSKIKDKKYIKIVGTSLAAVVFVVGVFVVFNKSSNNAMSDVEEVAKEERKVVIAATITKINNEEYLVKNIPEDNNNIFVVANDSTMVTFIAGDGGIIDEVFVRIGEKKQFPKGHETILVKTRIASSIDVMEENN